MSFKGTEYYRDIASFPPNTPPKSGMAYRWYILDLCDHIEELEQKQSRLMSDLTTAVRKFNRMYAENIEVRERVEELGGALRAVCEASEPHDGVSPGEAVSQAIVYEIAVAALSPKQEGEG